jgi:hypothetical protein
MSDIPYTFKCFAYVQGIERGINYLATCKAELKSAWEQIQVESMKQKQVNGLVTVTTPVGHVGTIQRD